MTLFVLTSGANGCETKTIMDVYLTRQAVYVSRMAATQLHCGQVWVIDATFANVIAVFLHIL